MKSEQIIIDLDEVDKDSSFVLAWNLTSCVWGFKINDLILEHGVNIVRDLKCLTQVFADVKLLDTPKSVGNTVRKLSSTGADFISVNAFGGKSMMEAALENAGNSKIIATITDLPDGENQEIFLKRKDETLWDLAHLSFDIGIHGIICNEVTMLNHLNFIKICTDTRRKSDYYILGKIITDSSNPKKELAKYKNETPL